MTAKQYFDIENNDSINSIAFKTNLKTTTNQNDKIMKTNATKEDMNGNKDFEDDLNTTTYSDNITMTTVNKNTNYWKKITGNFDSESDSDEDEGDNWEMVGKKIKKKNNIKKTYTTMQVKKNDIKHIWKYDDTTTSKKKSTKTTENELYLNHNKVSNIEKFHHNKRVAKMKTTNTREITNNMIEIGKNMTKRNEMI
jgi:hypothetical protein